MTNQVDIIHLLAVTAGCLAFFVVFFALFRRR